MGVTFAHFHFWGTLPSLIDFENKKHSGEQSSSEISIRRLELNIWPRSENFFFNLCLITSGAKVTDSSHGISGFKCSMFDISFISSVVKPFFNDFDVFNVFQRFLDVVFMFILCFQFQFYLKTNIIVILRVGFR